MVLTRYKDWVLGFQRNGKFLFFHWNQSFPFSKYIIMVDCDHSFTRNCVLSDRERPIEAEITLGVIVWVLGGGLFLSIFEIFSILAS